MQILSMVAFVRLSAIDWFFAGPSCSPPVCVHDRLLCRLSPPLGQVRCIPVIAPGADARSAADWWVKAVYPVDHYPAVPPGGERVVTVCVCVLGL